jgi:hypothetical protein
MIGLIDGDVLCYMACKSRYVTAEGHKYLTSQALIFSEAEDERYLDKSWNNFKKALRDIEEELFLDDMLVAVKGPDNFRNIMYPEYKMNRHKDPKQSNQFVPLIRKLAVHNNLAIESTGREADDLLRIWAYECQHAGVPYIVVSIDKDLKCIPGKHLNIKKNEFLDIDEIYATRFFYQQLLKGDSTDNIPGIPGVGEVRAEKALKYCKTEEEMQEVVVDQYMQFYDKDWLQYLLSNGKMIYLQRYVNDYFSCRHWPIVEEILSTVEKATTPAPATPVPPKLAPPAPVLPRSAPLRPPASLPPTAAPAPVPGPTRATSPTRQSTFNLKIPGKS